MLFEIYLLANKKILSVPTATYKMSLYLLIRECGVSNLDDKLSKLEYLKMRG